MKIDTLRLIGASVVDLPVVGADPSGPFVLKGAEGLGPPDINVVIADMVQEGGVRQKKRASNRQIVALIGLNPDWSAGITPEDLRTTLYELLTTPYDAPVKVQLVKDNVVLAETSGDVSALEASIFVKDPEVQVTIDCTSPYFTGTPQFETPTLTVSGGYTLIDVVNDGTAPAYFWLGLRLNGAHGGTLQILRDAAFQPYMSFNGGFADGEGIVIDSRESSRGVWRITPGVNTLVPAMDDMTPESPWFRLHKGLNRFKINHTNVTPYILGFQYTPNYWGV